MPSTTVRPRPDRLEVVADQVARIVDDVDQLVDASPARRTDALADLIVDASLLVEHLSGWHSRPYYEQVADRLWMLGMPAGDVNDLAVTTVRSLEERLISPADATGITGVCLDALRGVR